MHGIGNKIEVMRYKIILLFLAIGLQASAQYDSEGENKSRFRPGIFWYLTGYRPAIPGKVRKYDRIIFDVVYSDWMGDKKPFNNHWASMGFNTNVLFDIPLAPKNTVSLGIGLCYGFHTIRHNKNVTVDPSNSWTMISDSAMNSALQKSSFVGHNFSIPIELRFRTEGWKHFKVHLGGKIGLESNFYGKLKSSSGGKSARLDIPDFNRLTYGAYVRMGMRNWAVLASYNFNPMFSHANSTKLNMFQVGFSISLF